MQATATMDVTLARPGAAWGAVASMTLCVAVLIASEFMPVSLLTPIADGLEITEGQAGQAISISGLFAVVTSLVIAGLTRRVDRKLVLSSLSLLLMKPRLEPRVLASARARRRAGRPGHSATRAGAESGGSWSDGHAPSDRLRGSGLHRDPLRQPVGA